MATRAPLFQEDTAPEADLFRAWYRDLWHVAQNVGVHEFCPDVTGDDIQVAVRPFVTRHLALGEVGLWTAQPSHQPVRVHFAADFGQFGPDLSANQLGFTGAYDGHGMTSGAKHLTKAS